MNLIFPIPIQISNIKFDFTELRKDKNHIFNFTQKQDLEFRTKPTEISKLRILENYPELKKCLLKEVYKYARQLGFQNQYVITTSWLTCMANKEAIGTHSHLNCQFSAILYYDEDYSEAPPIKFANPFIKLDGLGIRPSSDSILIYTEGFQPITGGLIIFPKFLDHFTDTNKSGKDRRSLAFNVHPLGYIGEGDSSYHTDWFN